MAARSLSNKDKTLCLRQTGPPESGPDIVGDVAQLGEHLPCKQGVKSSNLSISTRRSGNVRYTEHLLGMRKHPTGTLTSSYRERDGRKADARTYRSDGERSR